ncbi:Flp family type IVb pilin [Neobacillus sp. FSL H8-0543]|uniref:Flp family type IVb pilin n=1 Tax=Neobacillus sp. FSL H8-0543 TaxID=2954672 RepID=UPI0031597539
MLQKMKNLVVEEEGQAMAEYGLLLALIAVVVAVVAVTLGTEISATFTSVINKLKGL